ncbi:hypothetical protein V6N13_133083 [Hibiscus sabdariffa]
MLMEKKTRGIPRKMKISNLCVPRMKGSNKNKCLSPMSLLERLREAVFRLIMLSALTKAATQPHTTSSAPATPRKYYRPADAHHSEAVADCIEFIKKKAYREENLNRVSSGRSSTSEVAVAVPVI